MKLSNFSVNKNENGTARKNICGCIVIFSFAINNGALQSLNARVHTPAENDPNQIGKYLGQIDMIPDTGKISSSFSPESEDYELELKLKTAIKNELGELRSEILIQPIQ